MIDFLFYFSLLFVGLAIMILAADLLVKGAVDLANKIHIPPMVIGLTIISFGTSLPELIITAGSALQGSPGLGLGNVIGSNISNILLVLGISAFICPICCKTKGTRRSLAFLLATTLIFIAFSSDLHLSRLEGVALIAIFAAYMFITLRQSSTKNKNGDTPEQPLGFSSEDINTPPRPAWQVILFITLGLAGLPLGGHLTVENAKNIAYVWGISEAVIGLTVVAIGTSLPELATSAVAAFRRETDLALGNVIGSNIFNLVVIVGISLLIIPMSIPAQLFNLDLWAMLAITFLLVPFIFLKIQVRRLAGLLFVILYCAYIWFVVATH